jgi:tRNA threonylcarbamoyl adenosine modification protein (Sua5/YciO/YrdC/YwlC family)
MGKDTTINFEAIAEKLRNGLVGIVPTDTNYGLVANPFDEDACRKLFEVKQRDYGKPLTMFVAEPNDIFKYIECTPEEKEKIKSMVQKHWPGALGIIANKHKENAPYNPFFDKHTISMVCNKNETLREIIRALGGPIGMTSANISGEVIDGLIDADMAKIRFKNKIDFFVEDNFDQKETTTSGTIVKISNGVVETLRQGDVYV